MPRVRAALETCDNIVIRRQDIDYLAFALVTPLQS